MRPQSFDAAASAIPPESADLRLMQPARSPPDPKTPWLVTYLIVNVVAAGIMLNSDYLLADASDLRVASHFDIYLATAVTLATYVFVAQWMFRSMTQLSVFTRTTQQSASERDREAAWIGGVLLLLQGAFMVFNLKEGINIAGSTNVRTDSSVNLLFVLLQPDIFFFVYYGYYRESKLFKYNLAIYIASNFLRGWSGFLLTIAFFEWCRAYRSGRLRLPVVLLSGLVGLLAYPLVLSLKWFVRIKGTGAFGDFAELAASVGGNLQAEDYGDLILAGIAHLVDRLQNVSIVAAIAQCKDALQDLLAAGAVAPFWWDGLPQLALTYLFGLDKAPTLGVALTEVITYRPGVELGSWSISPGLAGWILLDPVWTPVFIVYIAFLCFLSVLLAPGCRQEGATRDMLWYAWLVYLIPGWLTAFTGIICALAVLNVLQVPFRRQRSANDRQIN